jgi:hypothetical protein
MKSNIIISKYTSLVSLSSNFEYFKLLRINERINNDYCSIFELH